MSYTHPEDLNNSDSKSTKTPRNHKPTRLIRLPEVIARVGLSRSTIYNRIAEKTFPAPIRLGLKSIAFLESDIDNWIQDKLDEAARR